MFEKLWLQAVRHTGAVLGEATGTMGPRGDIEYVLERVQCLCARPIVFEKLRLPGEKRRDTSWYREAF